MGAALAAMPPSSPKKQINFLISKVRGISPRFYSRK
jgi:hypothetical protein